MKEKLGSMEISASALAASSAEASCRLKTSKIWDWYGLVNFLSHGSQKSPNENAFVAISGL